MEPFFSVACIEYQKQFKTHRNYVYKKMKFAPEGVQINSRSSLKKLQVEMFKSMKNYSFNEEHFVLLLLFLLVLKPPSLGSLNSFLLTSNFDKKREFLEKHKKYRRIFIPIYLRYTKINAKNKELKLKNIQNTLIENLELAREASPRQLWPELLFDAENADMLEMLPDIREGLQAENSQSRSLTAGRVSSDDFLELLMEQSHGLSSFKILRFLFVNSLMTNNSFYHFYSNFSDEIRTDEIYMDSEFFVQKLKENNIVISKELERELGLERQTMERLNSQRLDQPIPLAKTFSISSLDSKDYFFHVYNKETQRLVPWTR